MTALVACIEELTALAAPAADDLLVGLYNAASGKFDPSTYVNYLGQVIGPNPGATSSFVTNAGMEMGNFAACKDMNYYAYDYDNFNSAGLTPTFCTTFSIGAVCVPSACNLETGQFSFDELKAQVVTLLKQFDGSSSAAARAEFEACQGADLYPGVGICASLNSKFQYFTTLWSYLSFFGTLQGETSTECYPNDGADYDGNIIATLSVMCGILLLVLISTIWSALSRAPADYFSASAETPAEDNLLSAPLLDVGSQKSGSNNIDGDDDDDDEPPRLLSKPPKFIQFFDAYANTASLFSFARRPGPFACFDCLRAISALWVVLGHTLFWQSFYGLQPYRIQTGPDSMDSTFLGQVLFTQSFTMAVDTFFFLSAFLAAYFLLKECAKKPFSFFKTWISKFINRALRIWPAFAAALFGSWFLMPLLAANIPGMDADINSATCSDYGWLHALLFTNNILPWDNRGAGNCFGHTWYLACDMQLYLLLPPVIMFYMKTRELDLERESYALRLAFFSCIVAAIIGSCVFTTIMAWDSETGWSSFMNDGVLGANYSRDFYALPWTRFPAYYLGVCCAIMWFEKEAGSPDFKLTFHKRNFLLSFGILLILVPIYGGYWGNKQVTCYLYDSSGKDCGSEVSDAARAFKAALNRPAFIVGVAIVSLVCFNKQGGLVQGFMEAKVWLPMSLVSYAFYLLHPALLTLKLASQPSQSYTSYYLFILEYVGVVLLAFLSAVVINVCVETPFGKLQRKYMWK
ncbi:hypothetical protein TrST_g1357 [Triparma strigata]|uniref:Acyltransferase 3 domain-containing protein n=1 Tax=Triparma strigata TaxID=1606541 RepID=A0A9W7EUG9_9STRA|nr:hypothetical protein TrST_g1357 [Triparma strigata]